MTLKAVLDNIDELPEEVKAEYIERDGKFHLDLDDTIREHPLVLPLKGALDKEKAALKAVKTELAETREKAALLPENFDRDAYETLVAEEERRKKDPNYKVNADDRVAQAREQYESQIRNQRVDFERQLNEKSATYEKDIRERDVELESILLDQVLNKALDDAGVAPHFKPAAIALIKPTGRVERDEETGKRSAVIVTDMGNDTIERYVENWSRSDQGKHFVVKPQGGSAPGSPGRTTEVNPWTKDNVNLTEQGRLIRDERVKAERLMLAAGYSSAEVRMKLGNPQPSSV